jgi:glutathione S-transferase
MSTSTDLIIIAIKARSYVAMAIAQQGGLDVVHVAPSPIPYEDLPFGQYPFMIHGDIKIAQSMAIARYVARLANLNGVTEKEYALSEMLMEESTDLLTLISDANAADDNRNAAFDALFTPEGAMTRQLTFLEALIPEGSIYFNPERRLAGGLAVCGILDIIVYIQPTALANFPKLSNFYNHVIATPAFDGIRDLPHYYRRI